MLKHRLLLIILLALALRVIVLAYNMPPLNSDEAVIGLMARHIAAGERPLFYDGQSYYGPVDAYLISPLVNAIPNRDLLLRIVPLAAALGFVWAVYRLGRAVFSEEVGLVSALFAALSPAFLTIRGLNGDAAYSLILLLGTLNLLLFHHLTLHPTWRGAAALTALSMIGFYIFPLMAYFIMADVLAGLLLFSRRLNLSRRAAAPREARPGAKPRVISPRGQAWVLAGGLALAGLAVWAARPPFLVDLFQVLKLLFSTSLPVLLRLLPYTQNDGAFLAALDQLGPVLQALVTLAALLITLAGLWVGVRKAQQGSPILFIFVTAALLVYVLASVMLRARLDSLNRPRFLFPLYAALPLWAAAFVEGARWVAPFRPRARFAMLAAVLAVFLYSTLSVRPETHPAAPLLAWLEARPGVQYVYTDYWTGYWLAYESGETVIPAILQPGNVPGSNRYAAYPRRVSASRGPLYIFHSGSAEARAFQEALDRSHTRWQVGQVAAYTVFYDLSGRVNFREDGTMVINSSWE